MVQHIECVNCKYRDLQSYLPPCDKCRDYDMFIQYTHPAIVFGTSNDKFKLINFNDISIENMPNLNNS